MRMGMRRFTRLTNAFSKKVENHAHAVSLHFMHYNFARPHQTLTKAAGKPTTPAMAAGIARSPWSLLAGIPSQDAEERSRLVRAALRHVEFLPLRNGWASHAEPLGLGIHRPEHELEKNRAVRLADELRVQFVDDLTADVQVPDVRLDRTEVLPLAGLELIISGHGDGSPPFARGIDAGWTLGRRPALPRCDALTCCFPVGDTGLEPVTSAV